jgi:adenosylcobinamide kinase/adenosylcobinamide-phosphate guanylyltransferase
MRKFIFIIGGARSGKSGFAVRIAKKIGKKVLFIATCVPRDEEMKARVRLHKRSRPAGWKVIEENKEIPARLADEKDKFEAVIIDCLGLYISNLLLRGMTQKKIEERIESMARALSNRKATAILVSNDVGSGIVPDNPMARRFRDLAGVANQMIARYADTVYFMQAGIPIKIKNQSAKIKITNQNSKF